MLQTRINPILYSSKLQPKDDHFNNNFIRYFKNLNTNSVYKLIFTNIIYFIFIASNLRDFVGENCVKFNLPENVRKSTKTLRQYMHDC